MKKHAPGPWDAYTAGDDEDTYIGAGGEIIAQNVSERNARLIAAAPTMVEALEGAASYLDHAAMRLRVLGDEQNSKVLAGQAKAARKIIASAKGE